MILKRLDINTYLSSTHTFSAKTDAAAIRDAIDAKMKRRKFGV